MTQNQKSLSLAALVIAALAGAVVYLLRTPAGESPTTPEAAVATASQHASAQPAVNSRRHFAATMSRRFGQRHRPVKVAAFGPGAEIFRFTWPPGNVDRDHVEGLKRADSFHRELRGRGFTKLELREGERLLWSKPID